MTRDEYYTRATLMERLTLQCDEASWDEFICYYRHFIYLICRQFNLNHHDAEEITQRVSLKIWKKFSDLEYDKDQRFRGWLYSVIRNCVRDFCRKRTQQDKYRASMQGNLNIKSSLPEVEKLAEQEWEIYICNMALENIRSCFSEKVFNTFLQLNEGLSVQDLAKLMQTSDGVIRVYRKRVLDKLKDEIKHLKHELD